jgi:hypothetical protein
LSPEHIDEPGIFCAAGATMKHFLNPPLTRPAEDTRQGVGVLAAIYSTANGRFALQVRVGDALFSFTRASRLERGVTVAWSKTMTSKLAKVTGLALLAASFVFSGSLAYAEDTTSIQILTFDAVGNPGEIIAVLDCDTGDGVGSCPVDVAVAAEPAETTVADAFDPAVLEATAEDIAQTAEPAIRPVDAIIVTGDAAIEGLATAPISEPAAEAAIEDETTGDASNEQKAGEASAAIVVEVTQSATVAVAGQPAEDQPEVTGSVTKPAPTTPVSMLDGKNTDEDF